MIIIVIHTNDNDNNNNDNNNNNSNSNLPPARELPRRSQAAGVPGAAPAAAPPSCLVIKMISRSGCEDLPTKDGLR